MWGEEIGQINEGERVNTHVVWTGRSSGLEKIAEHLHPTPPLFLFPRSSEITAAGAVGVGAATVTMTGTAVCTDAAKSKH